MFQNGYGDIQCCFCGKHIFLQVSAHVLQIITHNMVLGDLRQVWMILREVIYLTFLIIPSTQLSTSLPGHSDGQDKEINLVLNK